MLASLSRRLAPAFVSLLVLSTAAPALADNLPAPFGKTTLPTKEEAAEAKKRFDAGLKLFKAKDFQAALTEFKESYRLGRKPAALKNLGQCYRELRQFPEAYEAFEWLQSEHGRALSYRDKKDVQKALKDLASVTGTIRVKVAPDGADVAIDGRGIGTAPLTRPVRVTLGRHTVTATKAGFDPFQKDVDLAGGADITVEGTLSPEVTLGHVVVRERHGADVRVIIDEKDVGPAPWEGDLQEGDHTVEVRGPKGAAPIQTIKVKRRERSEVTVDASATVSRLRVVVAQPKDAEIFVDDKPVGKGSWEAEVSPGEHAIRVKAAGYKPVESTLTLSAGEVRSQEIVLTPVEPPPPDPDRDYYGLYARFELSMQFPFAKNPDYYTCTTTDRTCAFQTPPAGAFLMRFGWMFNYVGIEAVGAFLGEYRNETITVTGREPTVGETINLDSNVSRQESFDTVGLHGFLGGGLRATSHGKTVRFTAGVTPGFSLRNYALARRLSGGLTGTDGTFKNAPSFALLGDAGIMLGGTPGFKFTLGAQVFADFAGDIVTDSKAPFPATGTSTAVFVEQPSFTVSSGTQIYVGPVLGMQFGS